MVRSQTTRFTPCRTGAVKVRIVLPAASATRISTSGGFPSSFFSSFLPGSFPLASSVAGPPGPGRSLAASSRAVCGIPSTGFACSALSRASRSPGLALALLLLVGIGEPRPVQREGEDRPVGLVLAAELAGAEREAPGLRPVPVLLGGAGLVEVERLGQRLLRERPQRPDVVDHVEPRGRGWRSPGRARAAGSRAPSPARCGTPCVHLIQRPPPSLETQRPNSVPRKRRSRSPGSCSIDVGVAAQVRGRQALPGLAVVGGAVDVGLEVLPPVVVEDHEGLRRRRSGEARMWGIQVFAGTPGTFFSTLVQVLPPSRVTCRRPSSVPTQITPCCDRARARWRGWSCSSRRCWRRR